MYHYQIMLSIVRLIGHFMIPTCTLRKRAGAAPWPVWATCSGWPLPQLGVPQTIQWSALQTASQEPQNWGVMPVYVAFLIRSPSLPFLISRPTSVPNWKLRRLSSMDQERFV